MRTIKFRGKTGSTNEWVHGGMTLHANTNRTLIFDYNRHDIRAVDPLTVGQFTGWHDAEGYEVYEGDVMQDEYGIGYVVWYDGAFWLKSPGSDAIDLENGEFYQQAKVIGNIHDNPELIN